MIFDDGAINDLLINNIIILALSSWLPKIKNYGLSGTGTSREMFIFTTAEQTKYVKMSECEFEVRI